MTMNATQQDESLVVRGSFVSFDTIAHALSSATRQALIKVIEARQDSLLQDAYMDSQWLEYDSIAALRTALLKA
jgi:hypothetical protein